MNTQAMGASPRPDNQGSNLTNHEEMVAVEGLEDLFKWASGMVADGEDGRVKRAREQRIRRQVVEVVQRVREREAIAKSSDEISYLQRRVIALLQKLQEVTEENSALKQILLAQCYALERVPQLEDEVRRLKGVETHIQAYQEEQKELLTALSRLKKDRDFLDDLLRTNENENTRLSALLSEARLEVEELKARRWWHFFWPPVSNPSP